MATNKDNTVSMPMKIVIIVFAVILVLSLCLPFFSSCGTTSTGSDSTDSESSDTSDTKTMAEVDEDNQAVVDSLEAKLASASSDSTSMAALANLGNAYMNWGAELQQASDYSSVILTTVAASSTSDASGASDASAASDATVTASDGEAHAQEMFSKAVEYYDQYLELNDSGVVRVNRALSLYYAGQEEEGIAALEELTQDKPDFSPGWYQLGMFYYQGYGSTSAAKDAFARAVSADAVESYGYSIYAQLYMQIIESYEESLSASSSTGDAAYSSSSTIDSDVTSVTDDDGTVGGGVPESSLTLDVPELSALVDSSILDVASSSADAE